MAIPTKAPVLSGDPPALVTGVETSQGKKKKDKNINTCTLTLYNGSALFTFRGSNKQKNQTRNSKEQTNIKYYTSKF